MCTKNFGAHQLNSLDYSQLLERSSAGQCLLWTFTTDRQDHMTLVANNIDYQSALCIHNLVMWNKCTLLVFKKMNDEDADYNTKGASNSEERLLFTGWAQIHCHANKKMLLILKTHISYGYYVNKITFINYTNY